MSAVNQKIVTQDEADLVSLNKETLFQSQNKDKTTVSKVSKFLFSYGRKQKYKPGKYIIREGGIEKTVYIILRGEVEILKKDKYGNDNVVTKLSGGGIILGEMSIFLGEPRSSSVRISKDSLALEFTGENFLNAVVNIPELSMRILKCLSNKLKSTNERVIQNSDKKCQKKESNTETQVEEEALITAT